MKSLKSYIAESIHTYNYTIKLAGDVTDNFLELFTYNLSKFDPLEISKPAHTPIQKSPYGFPDLENQKVCIIKAKFRYPATEPMIQQMAQLLGHNLNMVRMVATKYDDSIDQETELYANQMKHSPILTHEKMEDNGKEASKAYADSYLTSIKDQAKNDKINIPYAGKETKAAFDPFKPYLDDKQLGDKSPMSKISRPAKPPIGAKSRL